MLEKLQTECLFLLIGYPTSGPHASPAQYDLSKPVYFDVDPLLVEGRPWRYPYFPAYPVIFKRDEERVREPRPKTEVNSEDINALVPGTYIIHAAGEKRGFDDNHGIICLILHFRRTIVVILDQVHNCLYTDMQVCYEILSVDKVSTCTCILDDAKSCKWTRFQ